VEKNFQNFRLQSMWE